MALGPQCLSVVFLLKEDFVSLVFGNDHHKGAKFTRLGICFHLCIRLIYFNMSLDSFFSFIAYLEQIKGGKKIIMLRRLTANSFQFYGKNFYLSLLHSTNYFIFIYIYIYNMWGIAFKKKNSVAFL